MSGSLGGLLAANVLYLLVGIGLLPVLRIARDRRELVERLPLAYLAGVAATGVAAAHLALLDVAIGLAELAFLAGLLLLVGLRRVREPATPRPRPGSGAPRWSTAAGAAAAVAALVLLAHAWRTFAIRPLLEWDGWAIWAMKARGLYEFGGATGPVFTSESYPPLQHPLLLPAIEAIDFRAMGSFDPTLVHVQLVLLAAGFLGALVTLLRPRVPDALLAGSALALLAAGPVLKQLATNQADVPLAFFVALGVVALARWVVEPEPWLLVCAAVFLGAAALTKSEGAMFALVAFLALALVARRRAVAAAALGVLLIVLPWRLNVAIRDLPVEYRFRRLVDPGYLADHADRVGPAASGLLGNVVAGDWGLLLPLAGLGVAGALLARSYRLAAFALTWAALAFAGLVLVYWISSIPIDLALVWSGDRTIVSLVVGLGALAPLLAAECWHAVAADYGRGRLRKA